MLEVDAGRSVAERRESNFDLAGLRQIRLVLPRRSDLPRHHEPMRRIPREDAAPITFRPVDLLAVAAAAGLALDDRALHRRLADVVLAGPPGVEAHGVHVE